MSRLARTTDRKGERGSVLAMSAISMLSLILAAGLAIDVSHFYTAKAELQNVADAAALAAASQLNSTDRRNQVRGYRGNEGPEQIRFQNHRNYH